MSLETNGLIKRKGVGYNNQGNKGTYQMGPGALGSSDVPYWTEYRLAI